MELACNINPNRSVDKVDIFLPPIPNTATQHPVDGDEDSPRKTQLQLGFLWQAKVKGDKLAMLRIRILGMMERALKRMTWLT